VACKQAKSDKAWAMTTCEQESARDREEGEQDKGQECALVDNVDCEVENLYDSQMNNAIAYLPRWGCGE